MTVNDIGNEQDTFWEDKQDIVTVLMAAGYSEGTAKERILDCIDDPERLQDLVENSNKMILEKLAKEEKKQQWTEATKYVLYGDQVMDDNDESSTV